MKNFFYVLILLTVLSSCSEYQKALKSEDIASKFKMGEALYKEGKYAKANTIFAQIVPSYRGKPQAEKLMYLYSNSFYKMKDYYVAGYQFERIASSYPKSEKLEEASFASAKSYYMLSPVYSKDQRQTTVAIDKLQAFINAFPESEYVPEANTLIHELDFKLQRKAFEIAKKYKDIAPGYTKDFNAAIKSFESFLFDFPGSSLREDAMFCKLEAMCELAVNSVEYKKNIEKGLVHIKKVRLESAKEYSETFKETFANSKYQETLNELVESIEEELKNYSTKS